MHYNNTSYPFDNVALLARKTAYSCYRRVIYPSKSVGGAIPCPLVWLTYPFGCLSSIRQFCAEGHNDSVPFNSVFPQFGRSVCFSDSKMCTARHRNTLGLGFILNLFSEPIRSSVLAFRLLVLTRMPSSWLLRLFRSLLREILNLSLRSHTEVPAYNKNHPRKG